MSKMPQGVHEGLSRQEKIPAMTDAELRCTRENAGMPIRELALVLQVAEDKLTAMLVRLRSPRLVRDHNVLHPDLGAAFGRIGLPLPE